MPKKTHEAVKRALVRTLRVSRRRTKQPVILAFLGLTGSGVSTVARELGRKLHWAVIEKNRIRVKLREEGPGFTPASTDEIHYALLTKVMRERGNAILDSDFVEEAKRKRLERFAKRWGARLVHLNVVCERDVMIARMLRANYNPKTDIFKSAVIAAREHNRRYPWHYRWSTAAGGRYTLRRPPAAVLATLDTTDPQRWPEQARRLVQRLRRM